MMMDIGFLIGMLVGTILGLIIILILIVMMIIKDRETLNNVITYMGEKKWMNYKRKSWLY